MGKINRFFLFGHAGSVLVQGHRTREGSAWMCRICSIVRAEVFAYPSVYEEVQVEAERRKKHIKLGL